MQIIVNKSLEASAYNFIPPIVDGLALWSFPKEDAAHACANYAPGGTPSSVKGAPTWDQYFATVGAAGAAIQTAVPQAKSDTMIAVVRANTEAACYLISNYLSDSVVQPPATSRGTTLSLSAAAPGDGLLTVQLAHSIMNAGADAAATVVLLNGVTTGSWFMLSASHDEATGDMVVTNHTTGQSATANTPYPSNLGAAPLVLGQQYSFETDLAVDMALAAYYTRALASADLATIYAWAKAYFARRGMEI